MGTQWNAVDAVLVIGDGEAGDRVAEQAANRGTTVLRGRLVPDAATAARLHGERVLAFAGIGRPEKFFETLRDLGAQVEEARAFPDHHVFGAEELAALREEASRRGLHLVTTEKDAARIAQHEAATAILTVPVHLKVDDHEKLQRLLLSSRPERSGGPGPHDR
jgi:tetraacyldisaccharide 4'-kinase